MPKSSATTAATASTNTVGISMILDTITANISSTSATRWVIHQQTTIPANTLALGDYFEVDYGMYKNASSNDVTYNIFLTNYNGLRYATAVTPFSTLSDKWITLGRGLEVSSFAQASIKCYVSMTGSTWFIDPSQNAYHAYQSGATPGTLVNNVNYNSLPFDFTQTLYIVWATSSTNATRVRGYDHGIIKAYRK